MCPERIWRNVLLIGAVLVLLPALLGACQAPASETAMPATATTAITAMPEPTTAMPEPTIDSTTASPISGNLLVFAAAALTESFTELGKNFELAHPGMHVSLNFAGAPQLNQQIQQGAPADILALANIKHMNMAIESGRIVSGTQQVFAKNRMIAIVSISSSIPITQLSDLANPGVKIVLGTKEIVVGEFALDFLDKTTKDPVFGPTYRDAVLANVVSYEQTVKAVLTKVVLGEGDAGIVFSTDVNESVADQINTITIPDHLNTTTTNQIVALKDSLNPDAAQAFIEYVLSPEGQAVLKKYGFISRD